ncbi:hypothetical protein BSL82_04980 [Tardibacter chloracetimidivorans]|uniref:HEAT repeat domain-containing protein n=1 Tax=Tardibacter chloracetimidivorans TaxID=1921510 RepID=A0A1L3ZT04_9SPHN|nr:HEAT repeat domain-containing protein [Tardibacter chloracetimidivorans]API58748.1 hypothetical protein BSL82_04980 [Tardibacter chloracetimidivorans]
MGRRPGKPKGHPKPPGSGRQKGTPNRITRDVREAAQKHSAKAIAELVRLLKDTDSRVRVAAARELLDRAHGKPVSPQEITGRDGGPVAWESSSPVQRRETARSIAFVLAQGLRGADDGNVLDLKATDPARQSWHNAPQGEAAPPPEPEPEERQSTHSAAIEPVPVPKLVFDQGAFVTPEDAEERQLQRRILSQSNTRPSVIMRKR